MTIIDILYMVLFSPSQGLRTAVQRRPLGWSVILALFLSAIGIASVLPRLSTSLEDILGRPISGQGIGLIFPLTVASLIGLFIVAGVLHLIALLLGGRGSYLGLFCGLSFANLPSVFSAPLAFFFMLLGPLGFVFYSLGSLAISTWILMLGIIALSYNYGFSTRKAILTFLIPVIVPFVIVIALAFITLALTGA